MVVGLLGAALEDVVVEVGTGAANGARDEVGAGLLVLVPMQSPRVRPQILLVCLPGHLGPCRENF